MTKYLTQAIFVLVIVAIAFRVAFIKDLLFGTPKA